VASISQPVRRLRGFKRVTLRINVWVGDNSSVSAGKQTFRVTGA
jgi:hypothetical protein